MAALLGAVTTLWRLGRKDCDDRIKALSEKVDEHDDKIRELYERLLAEARRD